MYKSLLATLLIMLFASFSYAEKPEWAGKGKPTDEQKEEHREAMKNKGGDDKDDDDKDDKNDDDDEDENEDGKAKKLIKNKVTD